MNKKSFKKYLILKNYINYFKFHIKKIVGNKYKTSYSQSGEDVIIDFIFEACLKKEKPTYLDLGTHHSSFMSNTFLFYKNGSRGVCVEPDPELFKEIVKNRKKDQCLNIGVGVSTEKELDFYILSAKALNTFSKEEAEKSSEHTTIKEVIKVPVLAINEIIKEYCKEAPDLLSIDIEGLDFDVIQTLDFNKYRPKIICIETIEYSTQRKNTELINFIASKNYMVYADTYINTIFVDRNLREIWKIK